MEICGGKAMKRGERKVALTLATSLTALVSVLCLLHLLEVQAAELPMGYSRGVAQAQDEPSSHEWAIATVEDWGIVGWYTSLALEPAAPFPPRIAYYANFPDYNLKYAAWDGAGWVITAVDSSGIVGHDISLALAPTSPYTPHISYYDYTNSDLKHAWLSGTTWVSEAVDSRGSVGAYTSLVLELTAPYTPHISYYDITNGNLKHAWLSGAVWLSETVDSEGTVGSYTSMALEPTPPYTPHISYRDTTNRALKHAYWNGTRWVSEMVDSVGSAGWYTSLALEPISPYNPHISYFDRADHALKYASWDGAEWTSETVDHGGDLGWYTSLVLETTAPYIPHISYYDLTNEDLRHAWQSSAGWLSETVDHEGNVGRYSSIDLVTGAASYTVCISYYDDTQDALKLACYTDGSGSRLTVTKRAAVGLVPAGASLTYVLTITNADVTDVTGVVITDAIPVHTEFCTATHGAYEDDGVITWAGLTITRGASLPIAFAVTVPCTVGLPITNELYRVVTSTQGISSAWGTPVTTAIARPTLIASFSPVSICAYPNQLITFTDTSTTDGSPIAARYWDFGDGITATLREVSHSYRTAGMYTVTLTVTDGCGFSRMARIVNGVKVGCCVYLPVVMRDSR